MNEAQNTNLELDISGENIIIKEMANSFRGNGSLPFLFIGSGFSQRYISSETWKNLLIYLVELMDNGKSYSRYQNEAKNNVENDKLLYAEVASLIEKDFDNVWFDSEKFSESRKECEDLIKNGYLFSPFKYEIAKHLDALVNNFNPNNPEIVALKKVTSYSIAGVITTNYDTFLEKEIFPSFDVKVGQDDILFSDMFGIECIYKIHGSTTKPESMVINLNDYKKLQDRQAYLAAKLLTIFVENPIIFIGYSINDYDILSLLESIKKGLTDDKIVQFANRLFFIEWDTSLRDDEYRLDYYTVNNIQLTRIQLNNYSILYNTLTEIRATFNPKLYKKLKNSIFDVVKSNDATKSIFYVESNIPDDQLDKIDVIVGFNKNKSEHARSQPSPLARRGIIGVDSTQLYSDVMYDNMPQLFELSDEELLSVIYNAGYSASYSIPIFKYYNKISHLLEADRYKNLKKAINDRIDSFERRFTNSNNSKFSDIISYDVTFGTKCNNIADMNYGNINLQELENFIKLNFTEINETYRSQLKKLIKIYDFLKYYKNASGS